MKHAYSNLHIFVKNTFDPSIKTRHPCFKKTHFLKKDASYYNRKALQLL